MRRRDFVVIAGAAPLLRAAAHIQEVRDFGAKGDGKTKDTAPIQKAVDACGKAGGGTVHLSPGPYLSAPPS